MTENWNNVWILSTDHQPVRSPLCEVWWYNCEILTVRGRMCEGEHFFL